MKKSRMLAAVTVLVVAASCLQDVISQAAPVTRPEILCKHLIHGYPLGTPASNDLIIRDCYALSSNNTTKFPDWVCFYLTCQEVDGDLDLERQWRNGPWLDASETLEGTPARKDGYRNAHSQQGYDRGHMTPLASFKGSRYASHVNYYSNVVPQGSDLNQDSAEEPRKSPKYPRLRGQK